MDECRIENIIKQCLKLDKNEIDEESILTDYGMDSLNFVELIVRIEEEYDISIEDEDLLIENFNTISKIKLYLTERV